MKNRFFEKLTMVILTAVLLTVSVVVPGFSQDFKNLQEHFTVKAIGGSLFNLSNGGIVKDSEFVYVNGQRLDKSKSEYTIDYGAAVLIVNRSLALYDSVEVDYCYIPNTAKTAQTALSQMPKFQYTAGSGIMDMGLLYNAIDAITGNATYGGNFKTVFGNNFTVNSNFYKSVGDNADGDMNLHSLSYSNKGLDISVGYQKSSDNFSGMNYVVGQGNDAGLMNEKGLERMNFGLNYSFANQGLLKLAYNSVDDNSGDIRNSSLSYADKKFSFSYNTQDIGETFARFADIREADRNVLAAEKGVGRKDMSLAYDFGSKGGKVSYNSGEISYNDSSVVTKKLAYDNGKLKYNYYNRSVDSGFGIFSNLREGDREQMRLEAGSERTVNEFAYDLGKKDAAKIQSYKQISVKAEDGKKMQSDMFNVNYGNFEGQYFTLKSDSDFLKANALNAEDKNSFSGYARKFFDYNQGAGNADDIDRNSWTGQNGIDRKMSFFKYNFGQAGALTFAENRLSLDSGAGLKSMRLNYNGTVKGGSFRAYYSSDNIDRDFNRLYSLTNIEKVNYNNMFGMKNLSYGFEGQLQIGKLAYSENKIKDETSASSFMRRIMSYGSDKYSLSYVNTKTDDAFGRIYDISDSQRGVYAPWKGFDRKEYTANLKLGSSKQILDVNTYFMDQKHESLDNTYRQHSMTVNYVPDATFNMSYYNYNYKHQIDDITDFDNRESVLKMNKKLNIGKLSNNSLYAMYRTVRTGNDISPVNQKFVDFVYSTDPSAKFGVNFNYNIADYSETDRRKIYDISATQKITDKFGLTFGMGKTDFSDAEREDRMRYGLTYSVNDSFVFAYNYDKVVKGNENSKDNQSLSVVGKLPQFLNKNFINEMTVNYKFNLNEDNNVKQAYNDGFSLKANVLNGAFSMEKSSVLDAATKSWYNDTDIISYKNAGIFGSKLGIEFVNSKTTNAATHLDGNTSGYKLSYNFTDKASVNYALNKGVWNQNALVPVRSEEFSFSFKTAADRNYSLKYSQNRNELTKMDENIWAFAFGNGNAQKKGKFNIYAGIVNSYKINKGRQTTFTYNVEYEYMLTKDKFLSLLASKTTDVKQTDAEDYVTDTFGLNYRCSF